MRTDRLEGPRYAQEPAITQDFLVPHLHNP